MPRQLRIEYPGASYHVMARGNRREAIFRDDRDCEAFLARLDTACGKTGWEIRAFVLMGNHYHLVVHLRPDAPEQWSAGEVVQRWTRLFAGPEVAGKFLREERLDAAELQAFLSDRLAKFEVPKLITIVGEQLPRNASGKILKRDLRAAYRPQEAGR